MADFHQFVMIIFMEFINIGPAYIRGGYEGCGVGVGGGESLNKEAR